MSNKLCGGDSTKLISTKSRFLSHTLPNHKLVLCFYVVLLFSTSVLAFFHLVRLRIIQLKILAHNLLFYLILYSIAMIFSNDNNGGCGGESFDLKFSCAKNEKINSVELKGVMIGDLKMF